MANQTTQFKRTVSGTINSGMRSVFGGEGRRYFIIEHKDDSATHHRGEQQKLIIDEVFIGRDKKCQVLIDEQFGTVSREHAVIVRAGDQWKLIHRSSTNDTLVNGQRVMGEQILQNGDEIQLSFNGPRLGFIVPQGEQSLVKSIGMTARLNLFRQQALRPYKTALTLLSIVFCLAIAGLVTGLVLMNQSNKDLKNKYAFLGKTLDSLEKVEPETKTIYINNGGGKNNPKEVTPIPAGSDLIAFEPYVYFVKMTNITIDAPEDSELHEYFNLPYTKTFVGSDVPIASGFMTSNGYLITARHVVEPWAYKATGSISNFFTIANILYNMGAVIDATIVAESKTGDHRVFHYSDFSVSDRSSDIKKSVTDEEGNTYYIYQANSVDDYAFKKTNGSSNIVINPALSKSLPAGTRLEILGFPYGQGSDKNAIRPQYTYATTANSGLLHNAIPVTGANLEPGNSGGPVFCKDGKNYYVIGLVSSRYGYSSGQIVPISAISF